MSTIVAQQRSHFDKGEGKQELCPNSGILIAAIKVKAIHHMAAYDLQIIFHELVDFFFIEDVVARSIAFGTRMVQEDKEILNPSIVSAIQG